MEGIAFVDGIAVLVEQKRLVEMRACFDRSRASVLHPAAPVNDPAARVDRLQFDPNIKSIDRATGEEVPHFLGPNDDIDLHRGPGFNHRLNAIDRSGDPAHLAQQYRPASALGFFAHGEPGREHRLPLAAPLHLRSAFVGLDRGYGKDVDRDNVILKKVRDGLELFGIPVDMRYSRVRGRKAG